MVRTGVDGFFASVDRGHGDERGLEWISEGGNLILSLHRVQAEFLCGYGVGVWRRVGFERICVLGRLTEITMATS